MFVFRVITNDQRLNIIKEKINNESEAELIASEESLKKIDRIYEVQRKEENADDEDYSTIYWFQHGIKRADSI